MNVVFASGKGGTGKTTVATNYAAYISSKGLKCRFFDCDVEAPNAHIFLKPEISHEKDVNLEVPEIIEDNCNLCGKCGEICNFSAIVPLKKKILLYPELCHSCFGCKLVCPEDAINMVPRSVGLIREGQSGDLRFHSGLLKIGEASAVPLIRELKKKIEPSELNVIDSPPGTSCPMIETVKGADFVVLVTEPTPFGLNDLRLAVETVKTFKLPFGVIVNRSDIGDDGVMNYCLSEDISVLAAIPYSKELAVRYSHGELILNSEVETEKVFEELSLKIKSLIEKHETEYIHEH